MAAPLTLALSKGRILDETLPLLVAAGIRPVDDPASRKLILRTERDDVRLLVIRASDVPTFVEHGAADLGVAGKDVLLEHGGAGLYEPLDLGIARCRLMVAAPVGAAEPTGRLRIATKYVAATRRHYAARGEQVEIIKLYGSMELAPLVGLADRIVDLVDTGNTLRANGLAPIEEVCAISSRLVVNKAAMKLNHDRVKALVARLTEAVAARDAAA
ncbi:MAG: ATP phosphoribosyltransferase [Gammaproteobacteria bacterium]|jgi:ATP phosphoribosyltransferase|nr:ATP phosphoribosyltransferase [Gammaproteobacteria bacterium]